MIRKAFSKSKKRMGESKAYSTLDNCEENGWLHSDDRIVVGVPYKLKYLGSVEIEYVPSDPAENNQMALETMRFMMSQDQKDVRELVLTIASGRITLATESGSEVIMRHSTSRIAYSTVDNSNKRLFCYVALSRRSPIPLCHVFLCSSPKHSYELTFTCAQAFDHNFKQWKKNINAAKVKANASESGDIDPANARKSPLLPRKQMAVESPRPSPLAAAAAPGRDSLGVPARPTEKRDPRDRVGDARQGEPLPDGMLDVEDDRRMAEDEEAFFTRLAEARSAPNMLDIGIDPEEFNVASKDGTFA